MKNLIITLGLFFSVFAYSQDREEFAGVWQDVKNEDTVLVIYHNKTIGSLKFWNFKFNKEWIINEDFLYEENGLVKTMHEDVLNGVKFLNQYTLNNNVLTKEANGMFQEFNKLN
tara:strand:+ start:184 stop:525 length:342 start_codon:yes stop_codon:yes gene_type:complete